MATPARPDNSDELYFQVPTVLPKVYMTKGPSGWPETFLRSRLDAELIAYVKPVPIPELIDIFMTARRLSRTPTDWFTIVGFLGRTMGCSPSDVPHTIGIAFWAHVVTTTLDRGANAN